MSGLTKLSLICTQSNRLPQALIGIALRTEKFTVTKMSTSRWLIDIPDLNHATVLQILDVLNLDGIEVHQTL